MGAIESIVIAWFYGKLIDIFIFRKKTSSLIFLIFDLNLLLLLILKPLNKGFKYFRIDLVAMVGEKLVDNFTYYIWFAFWALITPAFLIVTF